ncbi:MAG: segregation/condensation protein A [Magnetospirillum sp. WYHS-4]
MAGPDDFDSEPPQDPAQAFVVNVEGFEGPLDLLLALARDQKVDLTQISILKLADQYLTFMAEARRTNLELAADYLVMAAWLAYLKSRLLLPDLSGGEEPSGEEMAAALAFHLRRLESMQTVGAELVARTRLGLDFFPRGEAESFASVYRTVYEVSLYDLLKAYGDFKRRTQKDTLEIEPFDLYTVEDALQRLRKLVGATPDWQDLARFLPEGLKDGLVARSALASHFNASLELVKEGRLAIRQDGPFQPIYLRAATPPVNGNGQP